MDSVHVIQAVVALLFLTALLYGPWQWICTDLARQAMFGRRDELFDMARRGELQFNSEQYRVLRAEINNMIRFAHELTWLRLLLFSKFVRVHPSKIPPAYQAIQKIGDEDLRTKIRILVADVENAALGMIFFKSPLLMLLFVVMVLPVIALSAYFSSRQAAAAWARTLGGVIQQEAALLRG